jgi:hypothetical protein
MKTTTTSTIASQVKAPVRRKKVTTLAELESLGLTTPAKPNDMGSKLQRSKGVDAYIAEAGKVDFVPETKAAPVLSNPREVINRLASIAPASEYFAMSAFASSLGYYVINQMLYRFRGANRPVAVPAPTVDIFNDSYATMFEKRSEEESSKDNGFTRLPDFDAVPLAGVYMHTLYQQRGNLDFAAKYPVRMPHEILHEMQTTDRNAEMAAAYKAVDDKLINASPAAAAIRAAIGTTNQRVDAHKAKQHAVEQTHILTLLKNAAPERLTDEHWSKIPLYVQYKFCMFVHKNITKAIAEEARKYERDTDHMPELIDLLSALQLELEAAARTAEVKFAFEIDRLTDKHELITAAKQSKFQRAPAPTKEPKLTDEQLKALVKDKLHTLVTKH